MSTTPKRDEIQVRYTAADRELYQFVGRRRAEQTKAKGKPDRAGQRGVSVPNHILGAGAELAVAKHRDCFWNGSLGDYDAEDVGGFYGVRGVERESLRLIVHGDEHQRPDNPDHPMILVVVRHEYATLRGWRYARDVTGGLGAKEVWRKGGAAWYLESTHLLDMRDLPERPKR